MGILILIFLGPALSPNRNLWQKAIQIEKVKGVNIEWESFSKNIKQWFPYDKNSKK